MIVTISKDNFESEVLNSKIPVLADFWAPWCGPCKMIAPVLEELDKEISDKVKIAKINVEENQELASQFAVRSIPTLMIFQEGKQINTAVGFKSKEELKKLLAI